MKTALGVGISVLSALAAQGKDFDRAELNAMLDKLAASPEPKVRRGPMAMCYKMVMPDAEEVRFTCPKCGAVTRYESRRLKNDLGRLRDAVSELKGEALLKEGVFDILDCSAASGFFVVGPNGMIRTCNHSPVEIVRWDEWRKLPDNPEWMHMVRHDRLPAMCGGCDKAAHCAGGCREAARVFRGSVVAPDPILPLAVEGARAGNLI